RHDVAVARQAGCAEHGGACRGDLLVRAPLAADVSADAVAAEEWHKLLGIARHRLCAHHRALPGDDLARPEVRPQALSEKRGGPAKGSEPPLGERTLGGDAFLGS